MRLSFEMAKNVYKRKECGSKKNEQKKNNINQLNTFTIICTKLVITSIL